MRNFKKLISVMLAVMMVMSVMPVGASTGASGGGASGGASSSPSIPGATLIFSEDFESGYTTGENLLGSDGETIIRKDNKDILKFAHANKTSMSAKVVNGDSQGFTSGNVLELTNSDTSNGLEWWIYINGGEAIDVTDPQSEYYGKQIIYEFDAKTWFYSENKFMSVSATSGVPFQKLHGGSWMIHSGRWTNNASSANADWYVRQGTSVSNKTTLKVVVEQNADLDTVRTYQDGVIVKKPYDITTAANGGRTVKDFIGEATISTTTPISYGPISFIYGKAVPNGAGRTVPVYLDNIKVYVVDPINFTGLSKTENVNPTEGIDVQFSQPIDLATVRNALKISLASDTTNAPISNAITNITLADNNRSAHLTMDFGVLNAETRYNIWIDDEFTSAAGAIFHKDIDGVAADEEYVKLGDFETCGKLEFTPDIASGTITGYDQGDAQAVTFTFSTALAETVDIANAFTVTDEDGNPVSGLTVDLSADRISATLNLATLNLGNGIHTIRSAANAVYNDANVYADIAYTFDTADFTPTSSPASVAQYVSGTETGNIITVDLGAATTLTNDNIITGFEVVNASGNTVRGLAAALSADSKTVTLDLKNMSLTPGKYFIKSTSALVDKRGRQLEPALNVSVKCVTELSDAEIIIDEDFEMDYTLNENWLAGRSSAVFEFEGASGGKWEITGAATHADNFMGVIDGATATDASGNPIGLTGKVLKITTGANAQLKFWRRPNSSDSIDIAGQNKMLVYEYDVWSAGTSGEDKFMAISTSSGHGFQKAYYVYNVSTGPFYSTSDDYYNKPERANWYARAEIPFREVKHHMLHIVDQTGDVDIIRTYADGVVQSARYRSLDSSYSNYGKTAYDFPGENFRGDTTSVLDYGNFQGIYTSLTGAATTVYIDNFKAYAVDVINFDSLDWGSASADAFNPNTGITLKFDQKIRAEDLKENLIIKDENGNKIANAVKSATLLNDGKSALVKFDFSKLEQQTTYELYLSFLFRSRDGAIFARDGVIDGGDQFLTQFTTVTKLETTTTPASIMNYDLGDEKTVTVTLESALKAGINPVEAFVVKDGDGNEVQGLSATISEDRKTIVLQLSGLQLGDGTHTIESVDDKFVDETGASGSVYVVISTIDFDGSPTPGTGVIKDYIQGAAQQINVTLSTPTQLAAGDISHAFIVEDANGDQVPGIVATLADDKSNITLDISGITLGIGDHTIKSTSALVDLRGRELGFEYKFSIIPFKAEYPATISGYVPGTDQTIEIALTYPLNNATVANISRAFVVKNTYGSNVSGLGVTVSADKKTIILDLKTLDIEGGDYVIATKTDSIVNTKGEILSAIVIDLSTSASGNVVVDDTGIGPGSGSELLEDFVSSKLLTEDFDNEDYARDKNWLQSDQFIPEKFSLNKVGRWNDFADASVSIVKDPTDPDGDNYVLKNVAGYKDATGIVIAGPANYHAVERSLDGEDATIPVDEYTIVRLSTKVYIPATGAGGLPTDENDGEGAKTGNTKDLARIIALAGTNTPANSLTHTNIRRNGNVPKYASYMGSAAATASGGTGVIQTNISVDQWHTIDMIFGYNPKADGTWFKSYEVWIDGTKITALGGYYTANYESIGGMLSQLVTATGATGTTTVYYDDWSIARMNKLSTHVNIAKEGAPETQDIKLQITNKLTDESFEVLKNQNLAVVKDQDGNVLDATVVYDNSGTNTKISITPTYGLKYQTTYTVTIAAEGVDDRGNPIQMFDEFNNLFGGFAYTFTTAKGLDNTIDIDNGVLSYDADYMHEEDTFSYTMKLSQPAQSDIIAAVATFSEDNELLGIQYKTFTTTEEQKTFTVNSELGAKYLRLFIWEKKADGSMGRIMQIPDEVTSR